MQDLLLLSHQTATSELANVSMHKSQHRECIAFDSIGQNQRRLIETFERGILKMNGLEELMQGNSVRWMRTRRSRMPSGENLGGGSWRRMPSGQKLGQPKSGEDLGQAKEKQAAAVLSPEMVMAEFDRQVGTIH